MGAQWPKPCGGASRGLEAWVGCGEGVQAGRAVLPPHPTLPMSGHRRGPGGAGFPRGSGTNSASLRVSGWPTPSLGLGGSVTRQVVCLSACLPPPPPTTTTAAAVPHRTLRGSGLALAPRCPRRPGPGALTRVQAASLGAAVRGGVAGRRVRVGVGEPGGLRLPSPALVVAGLDGIRPAPATAHRPSRTAGAPGGRWVFGSGDGSALAAQPRPARRRQRWRRRRRHRVPAPARPPAPQPGARRPLRRAHSPRPSSSPPRPSPSPPLGPLPPLALAALPTRPRFKLSPASSLGAPSRPGDSGATAWEWEGGEGWMSLQGFSPSSCGYSSQALAQPSTLPYLFLHAFFLSPSLPPSLPHLFHSNIPGSLARDSQAFWPPVSKAMELTTQNQEKKLLLLRMKEESEPLPLLLDLGSRE